MDRVVALRNRIRVAVSPFSREHLVKIRSGKMVFEIRPPVASNKGTAVRWVIDQWQAKSSDRGGVALYCGDDATDEDAFRMLQDTGITVLVGSHDDSAAQYYLDSQGEVDDLLKRLIALGR
jgi:trehalose-phosphatase